MNMLYGLMHSIIAVMISFLLQIIIHETGHMLAGMLTGWQLIYIQIFQIAMIKENKTYRWKKIFSAHCRCIMYPRAITQGALLYTLGGLILNILLSLLCLICIGKFIRTPIPFIYSFSLFTSGIVISIINGIPNTKKVSSDMACYQLLKKDDQTRCCHNAQLLIAKQLFEGRTYRQIETVLIYTTGMEAYNDILAYQAVIEYYTHLDNDEYTSARKALNKVKLGIAVSQEVKAIIHMEYLYLDLLIDMVTGRTKTIESQKYNDIEEYILKFEAKGDIHSLRVIMLWKAYKHYSEGDYEAAANFMDKAILKVTASCCLYLGEKVFCLDQLIGVQNILRCDYCAYSEEHKDTRIV